MAQQGPARLPEALTDVPADLRRVETPAPGEHRRAPVAVAEAFQFALVVACALKEPEIALVLAVRAGRCTNA
ncbi:MAG TPA: hypothetical protein VGK73_11565 [Polyangiaceae bacterium]